MNLWTLKFKDEKEEQEYEKFVQPYRRASGFYVSAVSIIFFFVAMIVHWILNNIAQLQVQVLVYAGSFIQIIFIIFLYKRPTWSSILVTMQIFINAFIFIEQINCLYVHQELTGSIFRPYFSGIFFGALMFHFTICKLRWTYYTFPAFIILIYNIIRLKYQIGNFTPPVLYSIFLYYCLQFLEKNGKQIYNEIQNRQQNIEQLRTIIDDNISFPFLVFHQKNKTNNSANNSLLKELANTGLNITFKPDTIIQSSQSPQREIEIDFRNKAQKCLKDLINSEPINNIITSENKESSQEIENVSTKSQKFLEAIFGTQEKMLQPSFWLIKQGQNEEEKTKFYNIFASKILWNKQECYAVVMEDITRQRESEQKDRLLATVSHDLRTPLQGSMTMMESALESREIITIKKQIRTAIKISKGFHILINDLLDFSQIINNKLRVNFEYVNITQIIKNVLKLIKFQTKRKFLELIFDNKLPENYSILKTDPNRLKQILFNLVGNSLKFTDFGFIKVSLYLKEIASEKYVEIAIQDSGIGITQENLKHLFKMYGRLEQSNSSINKQGVGLGLSISMALAKKLNTKNSTNGIFVESELGIGSKFWFRIPQTFESNEQAQQLPFEKSLSSSLTSIVKTQRMDKQLDICLEGEIPWEQEIPIEKLSWPEKLSIDGSKPAQLSSIQSFLNPEIARKFPKITALAIDDEYISLIALTNMLASLEINQIESNSGQKALNQLKSRLVDTRKPFFDVIFLDKEMPGMNGLETARKIIDFCNEKNIKKIPMVLISGDPAETIAEKEMFISVLQKPISKDVLSKTLERI